MRGARGYRDPPVSLFAFQDIMTAVIGILLLVVLLMCLHLSTTAASASNLEQQIAAAHQLEADLSAATAEEQAVDVAIAEAEQRLHEQRRSEPQIQQVVTRRRELSELYGRIAEAEEMLRSAFEELRALTEDGAAQKRLEELVELEQKKERIQAELDAVRRHRGLTYLLNQRFEKAPLLVVVSADFTRVGIVGSEQGALTFAHGDVAIRMQAVSQWLQRFSTRRYYVLLVVKPSAQAHVATLRATITQLGFSQGLDLLPEDWTVLQYSPLAEGAP